MTWGPKVTSNTTNRNDSRFIAAGAFPDGSGGVDFSPILSTTNPWILSTANPITLSTTTRNDPV
jgi:hypothetical protein